MKDLGYMESEVLKLLQQHANDENARDSLAPWIAKTSLQMGHLYSDLGLESREEMGKFMKKNFTSLAALKPDSIRWKKFLYDCIGKTAPACSTCLDIKNCFRCSLNPDAKIQKVNVFSKAFSEVKYRLKTSRKDLMILVSFEAAIIAGSLLFAVE